MKNRVYQFVKLNDNKNQNIIGLGAYGQVKLARDLTSQQMVAIKLIYGKNAQKQIAVHYRLSHPNIISLINDYYDKEKNITYMVMEYADNGTLYDKIKNSLLPKNLIRSYFFQICQGIKYLHENKLVHRDIKPENILLTKKNEVKICDFGFATLVGDKMSVCGTYQYMSPQMITKLPYDQKIDIWALGILIFQMIEGTPPFRGDSPQEVLSSMKLSIIFSQKFLPDQINLIKMILRVNSVNRPSISQILEHKYFDQERISKDLISRTSTSATSQKQLVFNTKTFFKFDKQTPNKLMKKASQVEIFSKSNYNELNGINNGSTNGLKNQIGLKLKPRLNYCKSIQQFHQKKKLI